MSHYVGKSPYEMFLLLRAHAEQCWLEREVVPVLRQLQAADDLPAEEVGAALAYLEATWERARQLATATEAALGDLNADRLRHAGDALQSQARRYHSAVRFLRETIAQQIDTIMAAPYQRPPRHDGSAPYDASPCDATLPDAVAVRVRARF